MSDDRTLQRLLDEADIAEVVHAYCDHFDRGEAEAVLEAASAQPA